MLNRQMMQYKISEIKALSKQGRQYLAFIAVSYHEFKGIRLECVKRGMVALLCTNPNGKNTRLYNVWIKDAE